MINKKFENVLIASDWDGTLCWNNAFSEENQNAIKRFINGGGFFTVASGRTFDFLKDIPIETNTYHICLNGAYIADTKSGDVLYSKSCDQKIFDIIKSVLEGGDEFENLSLIVASDERRYSDILHYSVSDFSDNFVALKEIKVAKFLLRAKDLPSAEKALERIRALDLGEYVMERSWVTGFEFLHKENLKGVAIRRLAKAIGAKKIIAVGDYENDISMIKAADVGYAVANAVKPLLEAADRITVHCSESAIAKIISDLEAEN